MVIRPEKGLLMTPSSPRSPSTEELEQIRSMNRLFLAHLQERLRRREDPLGLPEEAREGLRDAAPELLDCMAEFPRAVFALSLDEGAGVMDLGALDTARFALDLTVLHCAWHFSRRDVCQARFLLGLDSRTIQRLRALKLAELASAARRPGLLGCAFAGNAWFWLELLSMRHAEDRRRLALIALQPGAPGAFARASAARP